MPADHAGPAARLPLVTQLSLFSADLNPPVPVDLGGLLAAHGQITAGPTGARLSIVVAEPWRARALLRELQVRDVPARIGPAREWPGSGHGAVPTPDADTGLTDPAHLEGAAEGAMVDPTGAVAHPTGAVADPTRAVADPRRAVADSASTVADPAAQLVRSDRLAGLLPLAGAWTRGAVKAVPRGLVADAGLLRCWVIAAGRPDPVGYLLGLDPRAPDTHEQLAAVLARAGLAGAAVGVRAGGPGIRILGHRRLLRLMELVGTPPPEAPPGAFPLQTRPGLTEAR